ncbi:tyrosine-type recombinase/integrase [Enterococcus gilvus]|uniref:tyrosine-type recombinase/integrase n=1 Tax=Enterococcus gilvus TaxID=160453 RepID=UPI00290A3A26|nr:tyrosine-type recombinase/integrase [Enterococcus gilvus]MDU5512329.1 tyrosine-type recombinase/integrase [Enterococcus gilvus]
MSRRGENIYKRKDGRWEGRYIKEKGQNGRIHYGYVYSHTYKQTKEKLLLKKYEFKKNESEPELRYYPGDFNTYSYYCLEEWKYSIKTSTYYTYKYKLEKYIIPFVGEEKLNKIKKIDIQNLIYTWKHNGLSDRTVGSIFQLVKRIFKQAVDKKQISNNPCIDIVLPRSNTKKVIPLSLNEQRVLEKYSKQEKNGEIILLALRLGLRIGEISALKWENIDFEKKQIIIKETYQRLSSTATKDQQRTTLHLGSVKTQSSYRTLPMTEQTYQIFTYLKQKNRKSTYIFQVKGKPMEPRLITYYFHKIRKKAGLENIHFHQLRHTFATRILETQGTISSISEMLGHGSTKLTLDVYTGTVFDEKFRSLEEMEKVV